jgi:hypothetical protein
MDGHDNYIFLETDIEGLSENAKFAGTGMSYNWKERNLTIEFYRES